MQKDKLYIFTGKGTSEEIKQLVFLLESGYKVLPHYNGTSGLSLDSLLATNFFAGVVEFQNDVLELTQSWNNDLVIPPLLEQNINNSLLCLSSSGTTGEPKFILHDGELFLEKYKTRTYKAWRILQFYHWDHVAGLDVRLQAYYGGNAFYDIPSRDPHAVLSAIEEHSIEVLPCTPTFLRLLLLHGRFAEYDLSSLQVISYGSERMPTELLKSLQKAFPNVRFRQQFGMTETSALPVVSSQQCHNRLALAAGTYQIREDALWLKKPTSFLGYLSNHALAIEGDWMFTGDLVRTHEDGTFEVLGRARDVINIGGEKLLPSEIENILLEIPEILDCQVLAETHPIMGNVLAAKLVLRQNRTMREITSLVRKYCLSKLPKWKIPVKIYLENELLMSSRGKKCNHQQSVV